MYKQQPRPNKKITIQCYEKWTVLHICRQANSEIYKLRILPITAELETNLLKHFFTYSAVWSETSQDYQMCKAHNCLRASHPQEAVGRG